MKIEGSEYIAFSMTPDLWEQVATTYGEQWRTATPDTGISHQDYSDEEGFEYRKDMMMQFARFKGKYYYISTGAMEMCERIKMDKFDLKQFAGINKPGATIITGKEHFYRWINKYDHILVLFMRRQIEDGQAYYQWNTFKIRLDDGNYNDGGNEGVFKLFVRIMCFLELGTPNLVVLKEGEKTGTKKQGKIVNRSGEEVTLVRSDWNKIYVKNGFHVSGHWRWQHYGPNGEDLKLIFIEEFMKEGYTRTMKAK